MKPNLPGSPARYLCIAGVLTIIFASPVRSAPSISAVSGAVSEGQQLAFTGVGFGRKSVPAPVHFDRVADWALGGATKQPYVGLAHNSEVPLGREFPFAGGTGSVLIDRSTYYAGRGVSYRADLYAARGRTATFDSWSSFATEDGASDQLYIRWYFRPNFQPVVIASNKFLRIWDTNGSYPNLRFSWSYDLASSRDKIGYADTVPETNVWNLMEVTVVLPRDSNNTGKVVTRLNGKVVHQLEGALADAWPIGPLRPRGFGMEPRGGSRDFEGLPDPVSVWLTDVWVDTTPQRIELANCSAGLYLCSIREPQLAVEWSDTNAVVRVNLGRLDKSQPVFAYVVDVSGEVSAALRIDVAAPKPPGDVRVD